MSGTARALVLDFEGVISKTLFETHDQSETALGLAPGTLKWCGPFDPGGDDLWRQMQAGDITEHDYWYFRARETGELVGETWKTPPEFLQRVRGDDPASVIRPEALETFKAVKAAGKRLAILTNELDLFYGPDFRKRLTFLADVELIVDATYTKVLKPDPRAYGFVTEGLGIEAGQCVLVDDQMKNIRGAEAAGMLTVHFDVRDPAESYERALALLTISSTPEVRHDVA